ncbi:glycosyltransferase family 2 protein [Neobacillus sp. GCM10023253]|uniref:glycosyltransferase family 2 protein n=1 Tax=Neobacillus sp. GCM10023253 TaxID=3252644 RepID=UPI0036206EA0
MLSPVIVFVYNRLEHTKETIEALAKNSIADETEIYIFSDAPKDKKSEKKVTLIREYLDSLGERKLFKSVKVFKAESNNGLAKSVILGVSQIINEYGKVIVVEDDLVSSADFLQFMNDALDYYEANKNIWSISGYNIPIEIPNDYKSEVYLSYRGCSWGWATWKDRWENVDWNVSDYHVFKKNKDLRRRFGRGGRDLSFMLDLQMQGKIDSWAIRWCYTQSKLDMFTVYPVVSRIKNIGLDGTGTHSGMTSHYDSALNNNHQKCNFDNSGLDRRLLKKFRNHYMSLSQYLLLKSKVLAKKALRM